MIFIGQGNLQFKVLTARDLSGADDFGILYEKPDGTQGRLDASMGATLHETGKAILYDLNDDSFFDQSGRWKFQSFANFDDTTAFGNVVDIKVHENLSS